MSKEEREQRDLEQMPRRKRSSMDDGGNKHDDDDDDDDDEGYIDYFIFYEINLQHVCNLNIDLKLYYF